MLPDASDDLQRVIPYDFPFAFSIVGVGFTLAFLLEHVLAPILMTKASKSKEKKEAERKNLLKPEQPSRLSTLDHTIPN